jgi:hypothetical protein
MILQVKVEGFLLYTIRDLLMTVKIFKYCFIMVHEYYYQAVKLVICVVILVFSHLGTGSNFTPSMNVSVCILYHC